MYDMYTNIFHSKNQALMLKRLARTFREFPRNMMCNSVYTLQKTLPPPLHVEI